MTGTKGMGTAETLRARERRARIVRVVAAIAAGVIGGAGHAFAATTYTWDGGPTATGTNIGVAENWSPDTLPDVASTDVAQWNGSVAGNLSLVYSNDAFVGAAGNAGLTLTLAATQTGNVAIDAGTNTNVFRLNAISIAAGAGAFTLGDGAGSFKVALGGSGSRTFTNNSTNRATIGTDVSFSNGLAIPETLTFSGTGDWVVRANVAATNQTGNSITKTGTGTLLLVGNQGYAGSTTLFGGTLQLGDGITDATLSGSGSVTDNASLLFVTSGSQTVGNLISGTGALLKNGSGTLTLSAQNTFSGSTTLNAGTLNVSGAINANNLANAGQITVGTTIGGNAVMNVTGTVRATSANPSIRVGTGDGAVGAINVNAGTLSTTNEIWLGAAGGSQSGFGAMTVNGGSVSVGNFLAVGRSASAGGNSRGELIVKGGNVSVVANNLEIGSFANGIANTSVATLTGGVTTIGTSSTTGGSVIVGNNANGVLTVSGSAALYVLNGGGSLLVGNNSTLGIVNLNAGGTINTPRVARGNGTAIFNFNGGTLRANGSSTSFLSQNNAYVYPGGATIDNGGNNASIDALQDPYGNGVTVGSLTVSGSNFVAPPVVEISGGGGIGATAVANIDANGNVIGVSITNPGVGYTSTPTFTFFGGGSIVAKAGSAGLAANTGGAVTFTGNGVTALTGNSTYAGPTNLLAGTLVLTGNSLPDEALVNLASNATLAISGDERLGRISGNGNVTVGGVHTFSLGSNVADSTFAGSLFVSSSSTFSKVGTNTLTLNGDSGYTGTTAVRSGRLVVSGTLDNTGLVIAAPDNGTTGALDVVAGGSVTGSEVWYGNANAAGNTATGSGTIAAGGIVNSITWTGVGRSGSAASSGTLTLNGGTLNVRTGTAATGNLEIAIFDAVSGTVNVNAGSKVNLFSGANLLVGAQNTTGNGTVNQNGGTVTFFADAGHGIGGTGTLTLGAGSTSGTYTYNLNGGTLTVPVVLKTTTNGTARGVFNFNGGTLRPTTSNLLFMQGLTTAAVRSGGAVIDTNSFNLAIAQPLIHDATLGATPDGGLTKLGAGTLTLSGNNTYTGTTVLNAGTLVLSGLAQNAVFSLGGADLHAHATLGLDYAGGASPASSVLAALTQGYGLATPFSTGAIRATTLTAGQTIGWRDDASSLVTVMVTLPGDANLDRHVDFADLLVLAKNYGQSSNQVWAGGDVNYDGSVNFGDLLLLAKNYGATSPASDEASVQASFASDWALAQSMVPEPTSLACLALLGGCAMRNRHRSG